MRHIKMIVLGGMLLLQCNIMAQVNDKKLTSITTAVGLLIKAESKTILWPFEGVRGNLENFAEVLEEENTKASLTSNWSSGGIFTNVGLEVTRAKNLIKKIEDQITLVQSYRVFKPYGLRSLMSDLEKEKKAFDAINKDIGTAFIGAAVSGGNGYNYTAFLKIFLRQRHLKSSLLELKYQADNLTVFTKIFGVFN
ncbi:hypothetical protein FGM00_11295 [Aggregatimonas sangjinii]|uniref:Uncharacterized protein n=1 Tax=Aggregatimonas sangjinii TaxID=2583587 RepID=A0A5B7SR00_9FLAO|nr:hypothetical protein [Aggregatimonas sangjinii]QCX00662.1 hypothetical protein FGM00_11295 [Aggregatimonas sangjinii]